MRNRGDGSRSSQVRIIPRTLRMAMPVHIVVVIIRHIRNVGDARIGDVHVLEVAAASSIPRNVGLAVTKRAPSIAASEREADSKVITAKPRHEGGRVYRAYVHRSR